MATRQRRGRANCSHDTETVETSRSPSRSTANTTIGVRWLPLVCVGAILGIAISVLVTRIHAASRVGHDGSADGLLVTQQLDSLFRIVESQLREDPSRLTSYRQLLETFRTYDRQYVEASSFQPQKQLTMAYAARRIGNCSQMIGELEDSLQHHDRSRDLFASCLKADPNVVELFSLCLNAHTHIVSVQMALGKFGSAENEYRAALSLLRNSTLVPDFEYHSSILPELKSLAQLGIELGLYAEAMEIADRFAFSAKVVLERSPDDSELAQEASDASQLLSTLSSLLNQ